MALGDGNVMPEPCTCMGVCTHASCSLMLPAASTVRWTIQPFDGKKCLVQLRQLGKCMALHIMLYPKHKCRPCLLLCSSWMLALSAYLLGDVHLVKDLDWRPWTGDGKACSQVCIKAHVTLQAGRALEQSIYAQEYRDYSGQSYGNACQQECETGQAKGGHQLAYLISVLPAGRACNTAALRQVARQDQAKLKQQPDFKHHCAM